MMLFARGIIPQSLPVNDDPSIITPEMLQTMTSNRIPATVPRGGLMSPDQFSTHVGVVGRPQIRAHRAGYGLPPDPDRTSAQRLASLLRQSY